MRQIVVRARNGQKNQIDEQKLEDQQLLGAFEQEFVEFERYHSFNSWLHISSETLKSTHMTQFQVQMAQKWGK